MDHQEDTGSWTGGLGNWRALGSELSALTRVVCAMPWRSLADNTLDDGDGQAVPVVLVHGIFGDPTNFATLRRYLAGVGIRRFSNFRYSPRLDYQRLAGRFTEHLGHLVATSGVARVDVVAHSLGGLASPGSA